MAIGLSNCLTLRIKTLKAAKLKFVLRAVQEGTDGIESQYLNTDPEYPDSWLIHVTSWQKAGSLSWKQWGMQNLSDWQKGNSVFRVFSLRPFLLEKNLEERPFFEIDNVLANFMSTWASYSPLEEGTPNEKATPPFWSVGKHALHFLV